ncbi:unnamed protein product [Hermetia illucens]|uniref:Chitin-binding type-2 domain-containing protein n=1 Tax=Hermetia illucens TaxID=343691 RepID=A0A7R8UJC2_HERIL|nr:unnamed protein product [Hermetia illucens]
MKGICVLLFLSIIAVVLCDDELKPCGNIKSGDFIANKANPQFFFVCVNGWMMELKCSKYVNFDPIYDICTHHTAVEEE